MNRILLPVLGASLALGACTGRDLRPAASIPTGATRFANLDAALGAVTPGVGASRPARPATPVVALPAWIGRPVGLRERDDAEAFEQVITLADPARPGVRDNLAMLTMPRSRAALDRLARGTVAGGEDGGMSGGADESGGMLRPTEAGIQAELKAVFPGAVMDVVTRPSANAYGPYGLAIGHGPGGAHCLYAWQWIEAPPAIDLSAKAERGPLSLRVRLCRSDITLEAMAAAVNQLSLVPRSEGTLIGTAAPARTPRRDIHRARHTLPARARADAARGNAGAPAAPLAAAVVPGVAPRRYLGVDAEMPLRAVGVPPPPAVGPPRVAPSGIVAPTPAPGGPPADLPPEAYRGPIAGPPAGRPIP